MRRGRYGDGTLDERAPDVWRLRYRAAGKRVAVTVRGSKRDAQKELRRLLRTADTGEHVQPAKLSLGEWIARWIQSGAPGRRQRGVGKSSLARYEELFRCHVVPTLGDRPLQQLRPDEIDALYLKLASKISARSILSVHCVLGACLRAAVRQRVLATSPMQYLSKVPSPEESDHGIALDAEQVRRLVAGFRGHPLYLLVMTALATGMRRNELLALMWDDLNISAKTLTVVRSLERSPGSSAVKSPKTSRGKRAIVIDNELLGLLLAERELHQRIAAGVPDDTGPVDLSLVKLPEGALVFPGTPRGGDGFSFTTFRHPSTTSKTFANVARKLGFPGLRLHDLRGTAITRMLNAGIPAHIVAKRHGHDPAVMLRAYAKALPQDDAQAAAVMGDMLKEVL